ncbi:MAG: NAD(+)/NADH kinase [Phycisphaerales bacterium]|nr:NAD(+)/NADH kinase [Phycisphaerales bacterium]
MAERPDVRLITAWDRPGARAAHEAVRQVLDTRANICEDGRDLAVTIGGDGTVIGAARELVDLQVPVLGVNCGRLGFLAPFDADSLATHADSVIRRDPPCRDAAVLSVTLMRADGTMVVEKAINDAVLAAGPPWRMLDVAMTIEGVEGPRLRGDGLVVASATGSTAHNLSAGGPILAPSANGVVVTPLAPQSLAFRPIVLTLDAGLELTIRQCNDGTALVLDGQVQLPLLEGDKIAVGSHAHRARFVLQPQEPWWQILQDRMRWAIGPRLREDATCS